MLESCRNRDTFYFSGFSDEYKVQKNSIYMKLIKKSIMFLFFCGNVGIERSTSWCEIHKFAESARLPSGFNAQIMFC